MNEERESLIKTLNDNRLLLKPIFEMSFQQFTKPLETSDQCRKKGNELFTSKVHDNSLHYSIFYMYCKSIATAPNKSDNLALAYGNKSAFLLHVEKYEDCIKDIDRTMTFAKSRTLKIKLLCRKVECMKKLGLECQSVIENAKHYLIKIDEDDKKAYSKLIKKVEALPVSKNNQIVEAQNKMESLESKTNIGGFTIKHNETDGRHLVATKDYEPGDVIFIENLFATAVQSNISYTICQYCLKTCWSTVPCEKCSWAMFCSDNCKTNALQEFHDLECSLIPYLKVVNESWSNYLLSIRTLIIGIKTAGGIVELKDELESMNESSDVSFKGFFKDGKFGSDSIQNVFLLNCNKVPTDKLESMSLLALMTLIGLVKHTPLLDQDASFKDIDDLMETEELIFLGSLLLRLMALKSVNNCSIDQTSCEKSFEPEKIQNLSEGFNHGGSYFAPLTNLVKHSCMPNAAKCFAEDRKVIIYALQPIESDSQIVMNQYVEFDKVMLKERKEIFDKFYFACNCQACSENWPPILHLSKKYLKKYNYAISTDIEKELYEDCQSILEAVKNKESVNFTEEDIRKLSEAMKQAVDIKYPSYLTSLLAEAINYIYSSLYGLKLDSMKNCKGEEEKSESSKSATKKS